MLLSYLPSLPSFASFPSIPSIPSLSSPSSNIPSLRYATSTSSSKPKNAEVCNLDNSNTVLVYNLSTKRLYSYTKTELDLMRLSKAVHCIPIPRFDKRLEIWLPDTLDFDYGEDRGAGVVDRGRGRDGQGGEESDREREMENGRDADWVYVSAVPNEEWIARDGDGDGQRCRVNAWGVREWWRGVVFLPAKVRIERLLGRWGVVFVVEE